MEGRAKRASVLLDDALSRCARRSAGPIAESVGAGASIGSIHTMTRWTAKEILLEICARRQT
jgi:hypothetical protein